jgi:transposase
MRYSEIARLFGVSRQAVHQMAVSLDLIAPLRTRRKKAQAERAAERLRVATENSLFIAQVTQDARAARLGEMSQAWKSGATMEEMARQFGYLNDNSFGAAFARIRRRPDGYALFPLRRNYLLDDPRQCRQMVKLYQEGVTYKEIGRIMSIKGGRPMVQRWLNRLSKTEEYGPAIAAARRRHSPRGEKQEG